MGSTSDLPVMEAAIDVLREAGVAVEVRIISAHRTPRTAVEFASSAEARGIRAIIAGAGGAAHLAGIIAGLTPLPVIGVPIKTRALAGQDSLYATAQMPPGVPVATVSIDGSRAAARMVLGMLRPPGSQLSAGSDGGAAAPVATVAIGGARNAAILAVQLLSIADPELRAAVSASKGRLATEVAESDAAIRARYEGSQLRSPTSPP